MRKMKRGLSLVLASIMATALVGCSGGENTETTNTATTTENKETTGTTQVADEKRRHLQLQRRLRQQKQLLKPEQHRGLRIIRRKLRFVLSAGRPIMMNRTKRLRQHTRNSILILMCSLIM